MKIFFSTSSLYKMRYDWLYELSKYHTIDVYYIDDDKGAHMEFWKNKREACRLKCVPSIKVPGLGLISYELLALAKKGLDEYDVFLLDGYGFFTQLLLIRLLNHKKKLYFVNIDGMVPQDNESSFKVFAKKKLMQKFPYIFCGSLATNNILKKYGVQPSKIINHPFTSLFEEDIYAHVAGEKKKILREKHEIQEDFVIISVGRFSYLGGYGKGFDVLIKAAARTNKEIGWYIVGDDPTEEFLDYVKNNNIKNVHFVGYCEKEILKEYYRTADLFVLMTASDVWGLVVNEAMACGLPIITTNKCMAGIDLIVDGQNGYLLDVGDVENLSRIVELLYSDRELTMKLALNSIGTIKEYTIENMARIHNKAITEIAEGK